MFGSRLGSTVASILIMAIFIGRFSLLFETRWRASLKEVSWPISAVVATASTSTVCPPSTHSTW